MSKVLIAIADGKAKEFKAMVNGSVRFVIELEGRFYSSYNGRFFPVAKNKIKPYVESSSVFH